MKFFWVNLGRSYKEVAAHKFLWAPAFTIGKNGKEKLNAGWNTVQEVKAGDVIFCHRSGEIIYVAVALKNAFASKRPANRTFDQWKDDGFQIDVELTELNPAVPVDGFKSTLIAIHNQDCYPALFTKDGGTAQQYMVRLPPGAGALILSYLGDDEVKVCEDVSKQEKRKQLSKGGTRDVVVQARIGQGQFRDDVLSLWSNTCPVTGIVKPDLLIASHIVPWSLSNETEKIDPNNGFPFSPAVDKLFDKGYISFDGEGQLLTNATAISPEDLKKLGITANSKIENLNEDQKKYLARHRNLYHF